MKPLHPVPALRPVLAALLLGAGTAAHAARPMITDDARIVDPDSCQLETWAKHTRSGNEYWAMPGCNFSGNLELTVGGARGSDDAGSRTTDVLIQAKTLIRPLQTNGWGWGVALGNVRHPAIHTDRNLIGDLYAYVPASFSFRDDRSVVHLNAGWLRDKQSGADRATWGLGLEQQLDARNALIAETFGQSAGRAFVQAGLRHWLVPNRVQLDATWGNRIGTDSAERWVSLGLRLLSPPFLR